MFESGREHAFAYRQARNVTVDKQGMLQRKDQLLNKWMEGSSEISLPVIAGVSVKS